VSVSILYFAAVRDLVGRAEERIELPAGVTTIASLAAHLAVLHPELAGRLAPVRFARNEEFATMADAVAPGDVIALIPPVAGG
jgi:molybdopterin converting factor subunit 1